MLKKDKTENTQAQNPNCQVFYKTELQLNLHLVSVKVNLSLLKTCAVLQLIMNNVSGVLTAVKPPPLPSAVQWKSSGSGVLSVWILQELSAAARPSELSALPAAAAAAQHHSWSGSSFSSSLSLQVADWTRLSAARGPDTRGKSAAHFCTKQAALNQSFVLLFVGDDVFFVCFYRKYH